MLIVDGQVHLAGPGEGSWEDLPPRGISPDQQRLEQSQGIDGAAGKHRRPELNELLREMDEAGVNTAIIVVTNPSGNALALDAARSYPERFGVIGRVHEEQESSSVVAFDEWSSMPEMLGLRVSIGKGVDSLSESVKEKVAWLWPELERRDMPISIFAPCHADYIAEIAKAHPTLRITVDHLGIPANDLHEDINGIIQPLLKLAPYENVALKASALPVVTTERYPWPHIKEAMRVLVGTFGSNRVFWGSDISRLPCPYKELVQFFIDELDFLSESERDDVLGAGIVRWLNWKSLVAAL